ncbi:LysR family transcriptional regulator [Sphingomonas abietis]|uniref:LysR family transcriptional regulator n=1 Tax=Sphingomonas abietis TaxID=3012344 RepID=A0ABY7NGT3_9SPHN|nr:LysR family transcriptional regulator [Sphingomonas abietis]WBO20757.1 LysR family transcriptional regulator [Sphingomonas abietis]
MTNWDDVRYFLAVARGGSVRAAADRLKVTHSTVIRRIGHLEELLGAQVFQKLPSGYRLTEAGEEILALAELMEGASHQLETRVFGRDQNVRGLLRVALPPTVATHLLMHDFAEFCRLHPDIELQILSSSELVNLTTRQADVALRVVYDRDTLPAHLIGRQLRDVHGAVYIARDLLAAHRSGRETKVRWVLKLEDGGVPEWARENEITPSDAPVTVTDSEAQIIAVRAGLGMAPLSCFVGDVDPSLIRVPGGALRKHGTFWLLTHGETRKTKRVRLFSDFIAQRFDTHATLLAGLLVSG